MSAAPLAERANQRVVSGIRPGGSLHLAHLFGPLSQWLALQQQHECFFFVADLHAFAAAPESPVNLRRQVLGTLADWLAAGIDPKLATLFLQSRVPEVAELNVLLGMCTPIGWVERMAAARIGAHPEDGATINSPTGESAGAATPPSEAERPELITIGQLNYPLLQCADILSYRPTHVCVVQEQTNHVELCRDVARRFNHLFGRDEDDATKTRRALRTLGARAGDLLKAHRRAFQEQGDEAALRAGMRVIDDAPRLTLGDHDRLVAFLEGGGRALLAEPEAVVVDGALLPGTDGAPMTYRAGNTIHIRDEPDDIRSKLRKMPTDPARVRRQDPGTPENCPVWRYHERLSDEPTRQWVREGCGSAKIGCTDCKLRAAEVVLQRIAPVAERAREYEGSPEVVRSILAEGSDRAREVARDTLQSVRHAMGLE